MTILHPVGQQRAHSWNLQQNKIYRIAGDRNTGGLSINERRLPFVFRMYYCGRLNTPFVYEPNIRTLGAQRRALHVETILENILGGAASIWYDVDTEFHFILELDVFSRECLTRCAVAFTDLVACVTHSL